MFGTLYLIPTPLGETNLSDVLPLRVFEVIKSLEHFIVEDLRTARRFLSSLKLGIDINLLQLYTLNEHTQFADIELLLKPLLQGKDVGLLSDAGMPCIADPGEYVVSLAHKYKVKVVPLTGPSSILLALVASGLNAENFAFNGYLPAKTPELVKKIRLLEQRSLLEKQTQVFIETPYRNNRLLETVVETCKPRTMITVASDITGVSESIITKSAEEWKKEMPDLNKIPSIFLIQA